MSSAFTATHTVAQAMAHARQQGVDRLDAQLLLGALLQQGRTWLLAHDDAPLSAAQQVQWLGWLSRRAAGEPLAYILGNKEFFGIELAVTPDVLVPRPDTETLVEWALDVLADAFPTRAQTTPDGQAHMSLALDLRPEVHAPTRSQADEASSSAPATAQRLNPPRILDLGTGSGAIALALQHQRPDAVVTAVDASEPALRVARANADRLSLPVRFLHGHWLAPLVDAEGRTATFDLIVSNPPYIAEGDPHMAALGHEPRQALTAGPDGLDDLRHIVSNAPRHLTSGGWLLLEHGYDQSVAVAQLLTNQGFVNVSTRFDLGGQPRCTGGRKALREPEADPGSTQGKSRSA